MLRVFFKLLYESLRFSWASIVSNKMRMFLSLLGISIGIFSVISVLTVFDSMKITIEKSLNELGQDIIFVGKFPWKKENGKNEWWKYIQRPNPSYQDMQSLAERNTTYEAVAYTYQMDGKKVKHQEKTVENATIMGVSYEYGKILSIDITTGRYFSEREAKSGANVAIAGGKIAGRLLGKNPIGKNIRFMGRKLRVIGVTATSGSSNLGPDKGNNILIPVTFLQQMVNLREKGNAQIVIKPKSGIEPAIVKSETRMLLRAIHRLKPKADDDFAINEMSMITEQFYSFFGILNLAGWMIGGFSLLVGGFGIANIMFVSVKERTAEIGIQMALGAKRFFILFQFLFESVFLSLFGGIAGLILIWILISVANTLMPFPLTLTLFNILLGILVSVLIGLLSGLAPSYTASKMDPVEAMRSNI